MQFHYRMEVMLRIDTKPPCDETALFPIKVPVIPVPKSQVPSPQSPVPCPLSPSQPQRPGPSPSPQPQSVTLCVDPAY